MSEPARNRFSLDLEDLERQLRGAAHAPKPGQPSDPLAELTRIVGQDDPLKDLFAGKPKPAVVQAWQPARQEPSFAPEPAPVAAGAAPPAEMRGALDEFEALLRRNEAIRPEPAVVAAPVYVAPRDDEFAAPEPQVHGRSHGVPASPDAPRDLDQDGGAYPYAYDGAEIPAAHEQPLDDDMPDLEPRRSRKGLWAAAAVVAIGAIGVGGAMMYRSTSATKDGQPLVISADKAPTKVEPANPGGTEIPNQNKQIYEKVGQAQPAPQTKVVSRDEQPVDVQAARTQPPRVVLAGPGTAGSNSGGATNPLAQAPVVPDRSATPSEPALTPGPAVPGLGEPRKVRTVAIRPDGTPAPAGSVAPGNGSQPAVTGSAPAKLLPTAAGAPSASAAPTPVRRPATTPDTTKTADTAKVQERVATPAPATTPAAPLRLASAAPAAPSATPAPATSAIRGGTGDFTVQLAAPGSESEARATFAALQRKYPDQLGSQAPIVRKTELAGGKTVFRLRVGPYSRDDATSVCTALQSAGGQCFIAKN